MEVRVSKAFRAVPEGEVYPRQFDVGDTVTGRMAEVARALGCVADEPAKRKGFDRGGGS
ncbi:Hypothetical protein OINT_2001074 [Brucella intermedia LMG 3301]|uniref:Uncharacterized protein n=1 Tax=Brucella intermedia LMG 3301 TaxID=641118 RepID=C4WND0_9HYPH|nr:hypothetical protein [Brucella intermedia]EEQ93885.1 Hypothetical protein OINT_2001074 [Brucella intermedia LMG 3301]NKB96369.1 hypothetical protein [Brucella intermedia]SUA86666.1 Uncharacterised protein [Brucella intermedia]